MYLRVGRAALPTYIAINILNLTFNIAYLFVCKTISFVNELINFYIFRVPYEVSDFGYWKLNKRLNI